MTSSPSPDRSHSERDTVRLEQAHHIQLYRRYPVTLVKGRGAWVWDDTGKAYLDLLAGIAVNNVGHCHPRVVKAIQDQAAELIHISNAYYNEPQSRLAALLTGISGLDRVFFTNSGLEAMELCIKAARKYGHKKGKKGGIIAVKGGFHGRSIAGITLGKPNYQEGFGPLPSGLSTIPFNDPDALRSAIGPDTIALGFETIQGEGGIRALDRDYLQLAASLCKEHDVLMIADEVQCGNARTGPYFAIQAMGVTPDIIATAKGMGGGFPIGATLMRQHVADAMAPGEHGSTFGGGPLACAAAEAAVRVLLDEDLGTAAREKGEWLMQELRERIGGLPVVKEIRGQGLMIGVELTIPGRPVVEALLERGFLSNVTMDTVLRIVPPLVIEQSDLARFVDALAEVLREHAGPSQG